VAEREFLSLASSPPFVRAAERESQRFGLNVGRAEIDPGQDGAAVAIDEMVDSAFELIVLRYPSHEAALFARLLGRGFHVLHADSLLYAEKSLGAPDLAELERFTCRHALIDDAELVDELVEAVFDRYQSHYSSNPLLEPRLIRAGYVEWANSFITSEGCELLLLSERGEEHVKAFSAFDASGPGEIVLAGAHPSARRQGWFGRAFAAAEAQLHVAGCKSAWTSTQIQNIPAQRTWRARDYHLRFSLQTVHLVRRDVWEPGTTPR